MLFFTGKPHKLSTARRLYKERLRRNDRAKKLLKISNRGEKEQTRTVMKEHTSDSAEAKPSCEPSNKAVFITAETTLLSPQEKFCTPPSTTGDEYEELVISGPPTSSSSESPSISKPQPSLHIPPFHSQLPSSSLPSPTLTSRSHQRSENDLPDLCEDDEYHLKCPWTLNGAQIQHEAAKESVYQSEGMLNMTRRRVSQRKHQTTVVGDKEERTTPKKPAPLGDTANMVKPKPEYSTQISSISSSNPKVSLQNEVIDLTIFHHKSCKVQRRITDFFKI